MTASAWAQSITAAPDGTNTQVNLNDTTYLIDGGIQAGNNLFHSFDSFGLNAGETAHFITQPTIQNVLGRITGGNASVVDGLIQLSGSNANLYLVNPSGWILGPNASLYVPANFVATTATGIGFEAGLFSAVGSNNYDQLVGDPSRLLFQTETGLIFNQADLAVTEGQSLWLVGNSVLSTGTLTAPGGNVTIAAIPGEQQISIHQEGRVLALVLEALPVTAGATASFVGIQTTDLARYLTGEGITAANTVSVSADGAVVLGNGDTFVDGTVAVGAVQAAAVTLLAEQSVIPIDPAWIEGRPTVVVFPANSDDPLAYSFIDQRTDHPDQLLYGGDQGTIATLILRADDGIATVTEALNELAASGQQVDAINLVAEGNQGYFWLGNTLVNGASLETYQAQLQQWRSVLGPEADLLLYSCFTALGLEGEAFVAQWAALTGTDVAASTNATGSTNYGGDWNLEYSTGNIEAASPFTGETLGNWEGKLATLTVTNFNDSGVGTLRQRIETDASDGDLVIFAESGTVTLTSGDIDWGTNNLTLDGNGSTVDGNNTDRIFDITANTTTIQNITLQNGSTAGSGGGIQLANNNSTLTLQNVTVSGNSAGTFGGGIFFNDDGTLIVSNSNIAGNVAVTGDGGGINFDQNGTLTIQDSIISGNTAGDGGIFDHGGGVYFRDNATAALTNVTIANNVANGGDGGGIRVNNNGSLTVRNSTISGNSAGDNGGGIYLHDDGVVSLTNSTISGNVASDDGGGINFENRGNAVLHNSTLSGNLAGEEGGGIYFDGNGVANVSNSTISGNTATLAGGGVYARDNANITLGNTTIAFNTAGTDGGGIDIRNGTGTLNNTIVANNRAVAAGPDLSGTFTANSSLIRDPSGATLGGSSNIIGQDPLLLPLGNYGGPTQTHALQPDSPAINGGNDGLASGLTTDQRGAIRFFNRVDIGAVEFDVSAVVLEGVFNLASAERHWICPILPSVSLQIEGAPAPDQAPAAAACAASWYWHDQVELGGPRLPGSFHP
jgi:filamentous hemagglutinin family protein